METQDAFIIKTIEQAKEWLELNLPTLSTILFEITGALDCQITDDPGNEYIVLFKLTPVDDEINLFDQDHIISIRRINNRFLLNPAFSEGDHLMGFEEPFLINSSLILPLVILK